MLQKHKILRALLTKYCGPAALSAALSLVATGATLGAPCTGPGAPTTTQTECLTAVQFPAMRCGFNISRVNPDRAEYYLGDRSTRVSTSSAPKTTPSRERSLVLSASCSSRTAP